ncbi:hypothetical protein B0O80DRAFT_465418 [Mortierella sp. GBAus27b]|nr:hypothetical protein B0O80DRAFT_465418 [Mortierella sp. GBAus27b]
MKDGWICGGLEVLEICILVYKMQQTREMTTNDLCPYSANEEPTPEEVIGSSWNEDQANDGHAVSSSPGNGNGATTEMKGADQHLKELQVQVCEMLGRLTRLRVLRIEGERTGTRDCLDLTLETGLDRLAPLKNLEKLVVTQLDDKLAGKKEVEWIARNWIHHRNRRWLEKQDAMAKTLSPSLEPIQGRMVLQDVLVPSPKFNRLIGVAVNDQTMRNIEWLKKQCPALHVQVRSHL